MLTPHDKRPLNAGTLMRRTCRSGQEPDLAGKSALRLGQVSRAGVVGIAGPPRQHDA